jgi:hypothetical protein
MAHSHNLLRDKNFRFLGNTCLRGGLLCRSAAKARPLFGIGRPQGVFPAKVERPHYYLVVHTRGVFDFIVTRILIPHTL